VLVLVVCGVGRAVICSFSPCFSSKRFSNSSILFVSLASNVL
jgi:hypothetical protein